MNGVDPFSGVGLGRAFGEKSVRGFDLTFSAPKSVSVLAALADPLVRGEVFAAHDAALDAVLGYVQRHAQTRFRVAGEVVSVDVSGIAVGVFRQHVSRELDPQLHSHAVIASKVLSPDGRWLALDARSLIADQTVLSSLYHAGLRAELTLRLGVGWELPVNGIGEMAGVDAAVLSEFSQRSGLQAALDRDLNARTRLAGEHEPSAWALCQLGARPEHPGRAAVWDCAVGHASQYRTIRAVTDPERALGPRPGYIDHSYTDWARTAHMLQQANEQLGRHDHLAPERGLDRGMGRASRPSSVTDDRKALARRRCERCSSGCRPGRRAPSSQRRRARAEIKYALDLRISGPVSGNEIEVDSARIVLEVVDLDGDRAGCAR